MTCWCRSWSSLVTLQSAREADGPPELLTVRFSRVRSRAESHSNCRCGCHPQWLAGRARCARRIGHYRLTQVDPVRPDPVLSDQRNWQHREQNRRESCRRNCVHHLRHHDRPGDGHPGRGRSEGAHPGHRRRDAARRHLIAVRCVNRAAARVDRQSAPRDQRPQAAPPF